MQVSRNIVKVDVQDLGDYILKNYGPMSHLKLQKLLFYCQAYHLAYFDEPLFDADFQAWLHGPVCRKIYDLIKGASVLHSDVSYTGEKNPDLVIEALSSDQKTMLKDILGDLSTWTGLELERATHSEYPWVQARKGYGPADRCEVTIDKNIIKDFYKSEINGKA